MLDSPYIVKPGKRIKLSKIATDDTGPFKDKQDACDVTDKNIKKLVDLQALLYAEGKHALLICLQAMDAGGKDGTIRHVFSGINPQGCQVTSFKVPSSLERSHDFLWRHHVACPPRGMIGIHNRSHYETVLVERVEKLTPEKIWSRRYDTINGFERMLADEGTVILKFYLHISKDEQKCRLQSRLDDANKNWKFSASDVKERKKWNDYEEAFEDAISRCSTDIAPWVVVPADRKWFRNWVVSDIIVQALKGLDMKYPKAPDGIEKMKVD